LFHGGAYFLFALKLRRDLQISAGHYERQGKLLRRNSLGSVQYRTQIHYSIVAAGYAAATSSIANRNTARQLPQISRAGGPELTSAKLRLSQAAQPVVGSPDAGSTGVIAASRSKRPVLWVTIWKEVRHSAQTWLKQHFGSQE
jgi:hypothetical protein